MADAGDGDLDVLGAAVAHNLTHFGAGKGEREQFGSAVAGAGGAVPGLGASGPFRTGTTVQVHLRGGVGGGFAVLSAAFASAVTPNSPLPGLTSYLDSGFVLRLLLLAGAPGAAGQGGADFALPIPAFAAGLGFHLQAYPIEPGTAPLVVAQTGGLRIAIGH